MSTPPFRTAPSLELSHPSPLLTSYDSVLEGIRARLADFYDEYEGFGRIYSFGAMKDACRKKDFLGVKPRLKQLFKRPDLARIKAGFIDICHSRAECIGTSLDFCHDPDSATNSLLLDIARKLFEPKTLPELLAILVPGVTHTFEPVFTSRGQVCGVKQLPIAEASLGLENQLTSTPFAKLIMQGSNVLFVDSWIHLDFEGYEALYAGLAIAPEIRDQLFTYNTDFSNVRDAILLRHDIPTLAEAIDQIVVVLFRNGTSTTGLEDATDEAARSFSFFAENWAKYPAEAQNCEPGRLIAEVIRLVLRAEKNEDKCIEENAKKLRKIAVDYARHPLMRQKPDVCAKQEALCALRDALKTRKRQPLSTERSSTFRMLPQHLWAELANYIYVDDAEDLLDILLDMPTAYYAAVISHIDIEIILATELMNFLTDAQRTALQTALASTTYLLYDYHVPDLLALLRPEQRAQCLNRYTHLFNFKEEIEALIPLLTADELTAFLERLPITTLRAAKELSEVRPVWAAKTLAMTEPVEQALTSPQVDQDQLDLLLDIAELNLVYKERIQEHLTTAKLPLLLTGRLLKVLSLLAPEKWAAVWTEMIVTDMAQEFEELFQQEPETRLRLLQAMPLQWLSMVATQLHTGPWAFEEDRNWLQANIAQVCHTEERFQALLEHYEASPGVYRLRQVAMLFETLGQKLPFDLSAAVCLHHKQLLEPHPSDRIRVALMKKFQQELKEAPKAFVRWLLQPHYLSSALRSLRGNHANPLPSDTHLVPILTTLATANPAIFLSPDMGWGMSFADPEHGFLHYASQLLTRPLMEQLLTALRALPGVTEQMLQDSRR